MLIVVRISVLLCDFFMFTYFGILFRYFLRKKKQVQMSKRTSRSYIDNNLKSTLDFSKEPSSNNCAIAWILTLTIMKGLHTLTILSLNTLYVVTVNRSEALIISYSVSQKMYVPVVDAMITFSILYFFYVQGMRMKTNRTEPVVKR
jgi:hypothetical protein